MIGQALLDEVTRLLGRAKSERRNAGPDGGKAAATGAAAITAADFYRAGFYLGLLLCWRPGGGSGSRG